MTSRSPVASFSGASLRWGSAALCVQQRWTSMGGRQNPLGFSKPLGKTPQVKQGPAQAVARRIPGTTKVKYTNKKGRTFNFSIPVSEVMQPPVARHSAAGTGWKHIDTGFCDTGDLGEDMPCAVDEQLRAAVQSTEDGDVVTVDGPGLRALQRSFVELCRDYTLMDTRGMKTTLTYREIHNGPDYELYDRKLRRRRHWLTITHRFADVCEVLWPSAVLDAKDADELKQVAPLLSPEDMLEALTWAEAASTFAIRTHRPYDVDDAAAFAPLDLRREVAVLAATIRLTGGATEFFAAPLTHAQDSARASSTTVLLPSPQPQRDGLSSNPAVDRFLTCVNLCLKHNLPVGQLWSGTQPAHATTIRSDTRQLLLAVPLSEINSVQQTVRVIHSVLMSVSSDALHRHDPTTTVFAFSNGDGAVTDKALLERLAALCSPLLLGGHDALRDVDGDSLTLLLQFATMVQQSNSTFARHRRGATGEVDPVNSAHQTLSLFTKTVLARAKRLLHHLDGPDSTVVSGDDARVPLVELQAQAEHSHPRGLVHYKVGMQHAQGMRSATLEARNCARLLELVTQLESASSKTSGAVPLTTLTDDLIQRITRKVATGENNLTIDDVIRVLPHVGAVTAGGQDGSASSRHERLLAACAATIGVELQHSQSPVQLTLIVEGLASCRFRPSNLPVIYAALLRQLLSGAFPITLVNRTLRALLQLVAVDAMPPDVVQRAASLVSKVAAGASSAVSTPEEEAAALQTFRELLDVTRTLYYCRFPSLPQLLAQLNDTSLSHTVRRLAAEARHPESAALLCAYGVVTTFAAVTQQDVGQVDVVTELTRTALNLLHEAWSTPFEPAASAQACELAVDSIMALAALGEVAAPVALRNVLETLSPSPQQWWLHPLRTPSLGASILESLCALQLEQSSLFELYQHYVSECVSVLEGSSTPERGGQEAVPALGRADFEFLLRILAIPHVRDDLAVRAGKCVLLEVERLAHQLSLPRSPESQVHTKSSEIAALANRSLISEAEAAIVRGYTSVRANNACAKALL